MTTNHESNYQSNYQGNDDKKTVDVMTEQSAQLGFDEDDLFASNNAHASESSKQRTNSNANNSYVPLAAKLRPTTLNDYVGQGHILGENSPLKSAIEQGHPHSLIFWGPPGTGKTTLAEIIAHHANAHITRISAVTSGIKEIRQAIAQAQLRASNASSNDKPQAKTILFVDEVHRFNKSQQDAFLPFIEDGTIVFIGATTENPSFELNQAILSRARVYTLKRLSEENLMQVFNRAVEYTTQDKKMSLSVTDDAKQSLLKRADGDARRLLNLFESCVDAYDESLINCATSESTDTKTININAELVAQVAGSQIALYDKNGDAFYDLISAFHKSVRGSSPDAALYWYARILSGGGDALYVARRLLAIASEDIGNADPRAMQLAINAWDTFHRVGPGEGERAIAQAAVYMALAPKSNAVYQAFNKAKALAEQTSNLDVPAHLKNATSSITQALGHGDDYRYAHDEPNAFASGENYFPEALAQATGYDIHFYQPTDRGLEKQLKEKLNYLNQLNRDSDEQRY